MAARFPTGDGEEGRLTASSVHLRIARADSHGVHVLVDALLHLCGHPNVAPGRQRRLIRNEPGFEAHPEPVARSQLLPDLFDDARFEGGTEALLRHRLLHQILARLDQIDQLMVQCLLGLRPQRHLFSLQQLHRPHSPAPPEASSALRRPIGPTCGPNRAASGGGEALRWYPVFEKAKGLWTTAGHSRAAAVSRVSSGRAAPAGTRPVPGTGAQRPGTAGPTTLPHQAHGQQ
eukprot:scaffold3344_cov138-Isochrysis_galbana.AAC.7